MDSYGDVVAGIDATLDAFTFRWSGPSQANDSLQTAPILPSSLRFYSGQAWADLRFFKAESLAANALTIRDSLSGGRQGSYPKPIIVSPGPVHEYQILSSHSARKAENSTDGRFDLTIKLFDEWRNPAPGPAGLKLAAEKITGPGDVSGVFTSAGEFANTSRETSLFNMDSEITFSDVWYPVGHRVQFKLMNVQVALAQPVEMNFEYTPLSIRNYKLIFSNATFTAGTLQTMTMKALDYANNVITTLDSQLNERTLTFSGAGTSPNNTAPLFGSAVWVNGVASREMRLYKSERIGKSTFVVSDNAGIEGENENSLDVIEAAVQASGVVIPSDGGSIPQQVAGVPFSLTAKTVDAFGNLSDIGCSAGIALSVPTGTGTSTGGWGGDATNSIPFSISKIPGKGYYSLNGMTLFKSGTQSLTLNACGFTSATKSVVVRTAPVNRMVLSDSSAVPASDDLGLTGNSSSVERTCSNTSSATAETNCGTVYSFFWDAFGNRIDPTGSSCEWSWNNPTAQHSLDIKSPNNLAGQGSSRTVSSADFVDGTLSCSRDGVTKSIKYWGGVANLEATAEFTDLSNTIITSSNVPAGTKMVIQGIKVSASKNGELVPLPASEIIAAKQFTITRAVVLDSMPTNPTCILANSTTRSECGSTFTGYLRTAATAGNITLSLNGKNVVWGRSVDAGPASQIDVSSVPANATAGIALSNVTVVMKDQFGNPTNTWINGSTSAQCSTIGFGIDTATYTSSGKNGGQAVAPTADPPNPLVQSNPGEYKSTITLYKTGPTTVSFAGCGVSNTKIIAVSPNVARIGFLSTAANDTSVTAETTSYECSLTSNSPTNSNVNCGSIKAYYWDDWGNSLNGGSPVSCSWNYTNFPTGLTAATVPTTTFTGGTATLTATDFIDGTLSCSKDLKVASISNIYGGLSKINVSSTTPATLQGATLTAATGNVTFTGLTLYQRRGGFDVATRPLVQSSTLSKIHVDTGSSQNNFLKIVSVTESGRDTTNSIVTRTFATNGVTSDALNLNYTAASTSNALTLRIQGKTLSYTGITVNPGNAHAFVLPTLSAKTAGSQFSFDVEIQDIHLNRTSKNTSGSECTTPLSLSGSGASPAGNNPNYGTSSIASTGLHSISNVVLYRASASESLSVSGCGLSPATVSVIVNPASAATGVLRTTAGAVNTAESEVKCPMHASNNQLDCSSKTVYAYFWDTYGNNLTGSYGNCDSWSFDPQTRPDAINIATTAAASVTLGNKGTNTYVDGAISCTKSPLATPLSITAWGGVKEVRIVARSAANTDITSTNPTLTAASGNLAISAVNLRTTKSGVDTPSPISESRTLTWNSTATNGNGWGTGGTGATLQRGLAQQPSVTFANGSLSTADSYSAATYKFNLIKAENAKTISATVYGITSNSIAFSVQPAAANKVLLTSFNSSTASSLPALTAGTPFNIEAEVQDLYANRTTTSAAAGNPSCASDNLTVDLPAGQTRSSPGNSSNSVGTTGTFSAVSTAPTSGVYQPSNITLYNTSNTQLTLAACGVTTPYTLTVAPATVTNMVVNTNTSSVDTTALNEYECENNSTTGVVQCVELQARFWDNWGNLRADTCDTWSYVTTDTAPTPSNLTAAISNVSSVTPTHSTATYFNGQLTCTRASLSRTIRLWGGVSTVTVTHNVSGSSIVAGVGNVQVSRVTVQTPKAGNLTAPTKNLSKTIRFMSNSTGAYLQNGQDGLQLTNTSSSPAIKSCTFSGSTVLECNVSSAPYLLNFTAAQTAVTFDVSVHGVAATQSSFNVNAGTAATVAVSAAPPTTVTAGNAFGLSLLVTDDQGNPTATGCPGSVIVTGPTTSPNDGPTGTTSTSFSTSTGVTGLGSQSMPGVYTISGLKLFDARTTQTLNISACGLNATTSPNITVKAASPAVSRITTADARSTTSDSEMICNNSTTSPFAVSCGSAYAWFWDAYGNQITSSSKTAGTNDDVCTSWSFTGVTTPTANPSGYSASGAANSRFSGITNSSNQKWLDGTLTCNKTGASAALTVWGGVKSVAITAQDSGNNAITSSTNLTAAVGNLKITNITLNAQKAGNTVVASHVSGATYGTRTIYWNTNAVALSGAANSGWSTSGTGVNTPFGQNSSVSLSFSNGINTGTHNFNFVKADSTARTIAAGIFGSDFATSIQSTAVTFNSVLPATASALFATAGSTTVTTAGGSVSVSVTAKDEFGNLTSTGCTTATLGETATGNLSSPGGSTAVFPGALALGSIGTFNSGSVILKKVGSGQIIRASACGLTADTSGITVQNADSLNNILLSTSSSAQPAYNTSLPTTTCTSGTTVACPAVSAWGEDQFGNGRGLVTCGTWTYSPTSPAAAATLSQTTSSNTTTVTNSNTHVNGTLTCTIGALTKAVTLTGSIVKSPTLTCSAWTCSAGAPQSTCTFNNGTGYDIASMTVTPTPNSGCSGSLANGSNCTLTFPGTTGQSLGDATVVSTPSAPSFVSMNNAVAAIAGNTNAPNCSQSLRPVESAWSCVSGIRRLTVTFHNDNTLNAFNIAAGSPSITNANGATITNNGCSSSIAAGGSCSVTIEGTTTGNTTTLQLDPEASSSFSGISFTTTQATNTCP
ncbi:MAG: beta strand repeat-containing protein [Silvanigrellaceae bacterium]